MFVIVVLNKLVFVYTCWKNNKSSIITYTVSPPRYLWLICSQSLISAWIGFWRGLCSWKAALCDGTRMLFQALTFCMNVHFALHTPLHRLYVPGTRSCLLWSPEDTWDIRKMLNKLTEAFIFSVSHPFVLPDSHKLISGCQPAQNISICLKAYFSKVIESDLI